MTTSEQTAQQGRGVWVAITAINMTISLGLNIAHAFVYKQPPDPNAAVVLSDAGRVILLLLSGIIPVVMAGIMSHALFAKAPLLVRMIVLLVFVIGMVSSVTAQYELFEPAVGVLRALGTVAVIDIPALTALGMIERGNRAQRAAEQAAAEQARQAREQAAAERLAARQLAVEQAAAERARLELASAEQAAEAERLAAERAEAERLAAAEQAAAEQAAAERAERERLAAEEATRAERERRERLAAEAERAERERAEREARAAARAERLARAEQAQRGEMPAAEKKAIIRAAYLANPGIEAPAAVAAVATKGGQISKQRARAVLSEIRQEEGAALAAVRPIRQTTAV
ncbi:hypothetical protein ACQEVF_59610 [Nonomuraea polychroma]|uniref:hypothetical protein n=1 Tax=Nonomuraea polychroma TaxID=46176 RepID=UPI003D92E5F5